MVNPTPPKGSAWIAWAIIAATSSAEVCLAVTSYHLLELYSRFRAAPGERAVLAVALVCVYITGYFVYSEVLRPAVLRLRGSAYKERP
jgi:TctA family transporter